MAGGGQAAGKGRPRPKGRAAKERRRPSGAPSRPRPPWHPVPLAELLIVAGLVAVVVGVASGPPSRSALPLGLGAGAALLGTAEFTVREHFSGYRSHALLLALLPVALFHGAVVLLVGLLTPFPRSANLPLLLLDGVLLYALHRLLRSRYEQARR